MSQVARVPSLTVAGLLCASGLAAAQPVFQQEPHFLSAYRWQNLEWFYPALAQGEDRRIVVLGDSINSDDTNYRLGQGRARQWDVPWTGWTTPACSTSNWGGYHLAYSPSFVSHRTVPTATSGTVVPGHEPNSLVNLRYMDLVEFSGDAPDGSLITATDLPQWSLGSQWKQGDWTAGSSLRGRMVFLNDPERGSQFEVWSYRGSVLETKLVEHVGGSAWSFADMSFGVPPSVYTFHRLLILSPPGVNETGKRLATGGLHWYLDGEQGPAYSPLGVAGWRTNDWSTVVSMNAANVQSYLAAVRNPNTLIVQLGANDVNLQLPPEDYAANVSNIVTAMYQFFVANGGDPEEYRVVLFSPYDLGGGRTESLLAYAAELERIAEEPPPGLEGKISALNGMAVHGLWHSFKSFALYDGTHPTLAGVDYFARNEWEEIMAAALGPLSTARAVRTGGYSSQDAQNPGGFGWFSECRDDFQVFGPTQIQSVRFWGSYSEEAQGPVGSFAIRIYADQAGVPGALLHSTALLSHTETPVAGLIGPPAFDYTGQFAEPFQVEGGKPYWISIVAVQDRGGSASAPQWGWLGTNQVNLKRARQRFGTETRELQIDMAFELFGSLDCYANCDGSTAHPRLNIADFGCFLQRFASGDPFANCDQSTLAPVLNIADFGCYLQKFAAGCP